jgi:hypothetical protein
MGAVTAAVIAAGATAYAANKSAGSNQRGSGTQTSTQNLPIWQQQQIQRGWDAVNNAAARTPDQAVAGFTGDQYNAMDAIRANQGMGYAGLDSAIDRAGTVANGVQYSDVDMSKYQNPYDSSVVDSTINDLMRVRGLNSANIKSQAEAAGAWGGDRAVVADSLANESADRTAASTIANLRYQGFNSNAQLAQNDAQMRNQFALNNGQLQLSGNDQLARMIQQRRDAASGDAAALLYSGNLQQQQNQARNDWVNQSAEMIAGTGGGNYGGTTTSSGASYGPPIDRTAATLQGLNSGLQFGQNIYDWYNKSFGGGAPTSPSMMMDDPSTGGYTGDYGGYDQRMWA